MTLTGSSSGSTITDGSGNYSFTSLLSGGNYTVTPSKAPLAAGSAGITIVDVVAAQRQALNLGAPLTGCRLTAADVNNNSSVDTVDVIAIQRFSLGLTTGIANTGKYNFTPASRTYSAIVTNQNGQNYNALIYGDVASGFVHRPENGPSPDSVAEETKSDDVGVKIEAVVLPNGSVGSRVTDFIAPVTTTVIDEKDQLVGFQGDFTFDERMVMFLDPPVENAGLTDGDWEVSGNVLPGKGPIRTLRVSAFSLDFTPLSGSGTLFQLRMRMKSAASRATQLLWAPPPDDFIFIDADLNLRRPDYVGQGSVKSN